MNLIEDVIIGITKKLEVFKVDVYIDEIKTKLNTPSFLVQLIEHSHIRHPSNRYKKVFPVEVVYFPDVRKNKSVNCEIYDVISELNYLLEIIELSDGTLIRGLYMDHLVEDNTLHFYVTYSTFVRLENDVVKMKTLDQKNGVDVD